MENLEIAANLMTSIAIVLAGRNNVHTWWTGIVGCVLFAVLFYQSQLYADVILQLFFVVTSILGWWRWKKGDNGQSLAISHGDLRRLSWIIPTGLIATGSYGALLHFFTNAYAPFLDSSVLVFSVIAQLLLMQRKVENWPFWLIVNSIAVPLYASRGLHLTAILYAGYWLNAIFSWWWWHKLARGTRSSVFK
ncbi:MAG: nicotinamide riboside transporter PnuC [Burkholderiaceae bacterium]|nr:MAG: nicotinamide riboside transporter PnuC [Burkholderiaceae bacterium]